MNPLFIFVLILISGYAITYLITKFASRYYISSGIEYIFIGILIGPAFNNWINSQFGFNIPNIVNREVLSQLNPFISASIGLLGLAYGLRFKFTSIKKMEIEHIRLAFFDILTSIIAIGGISFLAFYFLFGNKIDIYFIVAAALALGTIGAVNSHSLISEIIKRFNSKGNITKAISDSSKFNSYLSILVFGLVFIFIHIKGNFRFSAVEWAVVSLLLSVLIGFLFFVFLSREEDENKLFVAVLGITLFTSGVAYYMYFSPLYMNFIVGIVLANFSSIHEKLENALSKIIHPFQIVIVIFAGFIWLPPDFYTFLIFVPGFLLLRFVVKKAAGSLAFHAAFEKEKLSEEIGSGLLSHGTIATAMIIDYVTVYQNNFTPIIVSAILSSVIFFEILSYFSVKNLFIDSGEITKEVL